MKRILWISICTAVGGGLILSALSGSLAMLAIACAIVGSSLLFSFAAATYALGNETETDKKADFEVPHRAYTGGN